MNPLYANLPTTIFEKMSLLARETGAINLGQGFPDAGWPRDVLEAAARALTEGYNQYPPMLGIPELRQAIADHYRRHQAIDLDWQTEITVTSGATEALAASILALVSPGDEVLMIQPMYDAYLPMVKQAGGVPKLIRLEPPEWRLTETALAEAFTPRTRIVLLNNPLNPTATMFSDEELALLARFVVAHDAVVISDEVWEHVVFDGRAHSPIMAQPGMRERTVKIGSGGKIFSLTGWKVGWMCAAPRLNQVLARAHQFLTFTTPPNLQAAIAYGLGKTDDYFTTMRADFARSRDRLASGLETAGWKTLPSAGTYFLSVDLAASGIALDDVAFCDRLAREGDVVAIPVSAFYAEAPVTSVVRFCFAKTDATIDAALERMAKARKLFG
ncbi:aminotransferase [Sphingosinicella microcystinivorans]|uniref:aspartate transaminase n=1 Tax=Sphingosinicella microcystinivorans TaxID=335406 RepID=A0AAD1D2W2_SPHMI|nr:aminotransferase [Sphingosinicella microcystinivorans]RKS88960.1 aspartate/methionine/tyrosine aminotransferase [Sphingosinicella microcystinivorans]BBE32715.1 aspartate aminotransferase [Sphingosinicella microcystinivorans]